MLFVYLIGGLFFTWLVFITFHLYKTRRHYSNLVSRTKKDKIDDILDKIVEDDVRMSHEVDKIKKEIKGIIEDSRIHLQQVGLVGFNPFGRNAVEQSFVLALLNGEKNGIVINFIYTHDGVRVYAKKIKKGEGEQHKLSDEEREAIRKAEIVN